MELIKFLLSDANLEFKWFVLKLNMRIWYGELSVPLINTYWSIVGDPHFWMTGAATCALVFFASAKEKDTRNVEWG